MRIQNKKLRKEFAQPGYCELCHFYCAKREGHHLYARGMGGNNVLDIRINLISLGAAIKLPDGRTRFSCSCHRAIHDGHFTRENILKVVAFREKCLSEEIVEVLDWMRRIVKPTPMGLERALEELSAPAKVIAERELKEAADAQMRRKAKR